MKTAVAKSKLLAGTAVAAATAVANANGEPATKVQLLPIGDITARDGRKWRVRDAAHAQAIVDASKATAGGTDLPIDYDHQLVFGAKDGVGGQAPAAGWMSNLRVEADGIWADVDWTAAASAKLAAREYRYISPYFGFDTASGDVSRIFHAGLVNFPAITELAAVASADLDDDSMDLKALAKVFGLGETATIEQIVAAATAAHAASAAASTSLQAIATAVKAKADAKPEEIAAAVTTAVAAAEPDPRAYVPMAAFNELKAQVVSLQGAGLDAAATAAVDAATAAGKITPAGREHALKLYRADPAAFADFVGTAPVVVKTGAAETAGAKVDLDAPLTPEEKAAASAIGVSDEAYLASKKQLMGAR